MRYWCLAFYLILSFCQNSTAQEGVYFTDKILDKIYKMNVDGSDVEAVIEGSEFRYLVLDESRSKIFASDSGRGQIVSFDLDGSNEEVIVSGLSFPKGIAVYQDFIYIIDDVDLLKYDMNGVFQEKVLSDLDLPLAIGIGDDIIFMSARKNFDSRIDKYNLDGSLIGRIENEIYSPRQIMVDKENQQLYWAQNTGSTESGIFRGDYNGANRSTLYDKSVTGFDIDFTTMDIYWTRTNTGFSLYFDNLDDLGSEELLIKNINNPQGVHIDPSNNRLIVPCINYDERIISYDIKTAQNRATLHKSLLNFPSKIVLNKEEDKIYWINANSGFTNDRKSQSIMSANLDGTNIEYLVTEADGLKRPTDILYDDQEKALLFSDLDKRSISKIDISTSQNLIEDLVEVPSSKIICFDKAPSSDDIILFDRQDDIVKRVNVESGEITELLATDNIYVADLEIGRNEVYLTFGSEGLIVAMDKVSNRIDTLVLSENPVFHRPSALSYDRKLDRLFYTISFSGEKVQSCAPDGSDIQTLIGDDLEGPEGIVSLGDDLTSVFDFPNISVDLSLYPNPCVSGLTLNSNEDLKSVEVYTIQGNLVYFKDLLRSNNTSIDVSGLDAGPYLLKVKTRSGRMLGKKFVKLLK